MHDFSDQRVIVTGGTRGIGAAITDAFLNAKAEVIAIYGSDDEAAAKFAAGKQRLRIAKLDVSDHAAVEKLFGELDGPIQVLVNNAGIRRDAIVGMMKKEDWRRVMDVNLDGTFYMSKYAVQAMSRQRYGRIVNVVSPSAHLGFHGQANYAASKAGQIAMAKSLAREVGKRNITCNCVSPGFVDTDLLADLDEAKKKEFLAMVPMGRFGEPREVAACVLFLASREASYVNGSVLEVTGGI
jgi:3-oxoacyl-[acyl-carrier protein] reductase